LDSDTKYEQVKNELSIEIIGTGAGRVDYHAWIDRCRRLVALLLQANDGKGGA
jgi:hypothetical protein